MNQKHFRNKKLFESFGGSDSFLYFCKRIIKKGKTMARPIKETPILYGEEARQFETRMMNPQPVSREWMESMQRDYEFMSSRCVNCSF